MQSAGLKTSKARCPKSLRLFVRPSFALLTLLGPHADLQRELAIHDEVPAQAVLRRVNDWLDPQTVRDVGEVAVEDVSG